MQKLLRSLCNIFSDSCERAHKITVQQLLNNCETAFRLPRNGFLDNWAKCHNKPVQQLLRLLCNTFSDRLTKTFNMKIKNVWTKTHNSDSLMVSLFLHLFSFLEYLAGENKTNLIQLWTDIGLLYPCCPACHYQS